MKYLLSWVCRHLEIDNWKELGEIDEIIKKISLHVAEVSSYRSIEYDTLDIGFAKIIDSTEDLCVAQYNNEEKIINLPVGIAEQEGLVYAVIQYEQNRYRFATMKDFHSETKNHILSPLSGDIEENIKYLKSLKTKLDYIITIDSVDIGHRPDLFCHRGLARECAILFDKKLLDDSAIYFNIPLFQIEKPDKKNKSKTLITNKSESVSSFAALKIKLNEMFSVFEYSVMLSAVDVSTHSFLIDISNYVLFDIGQPIHVFDKQYITIPSFKDYATGEFLGLDNTTLEITSGNLVLEDQDKIISLVGIMGNKANGVSLQTKEVLIESVAPKKEIIKHAIKLFGKKTESAIRMEKGISVFAPQFGIRAFLKIITKYQSIHGYDAQIEYIDKALLFPDTVTLAKSYVEKVIGITVSKELIKTILTKLGCTIISNTLENIFSIQAPWWRRDLHIADDYVEEIVRFIGYDNIPLNPTFIQAQTIKKDSFIYELKKQTVFFADANEIISYGIANEEIKKAWNMSKDYSLELKNNYNDRYRSMSTSHIPGLLDIANKQIKNGINELRLFEINPVWKKNEQIYNEQMQYAFLGYTPQDFDFYKYQNLIKKIFLNLGYNLSFHNIKNFEATAPLYSEIKSGIFINDICIGFCGFIDPLLIYKNIKSSLFFFSAEININLLQSLKQESIIEDNFLFFDISCLILKNQKIYELHQQLKIAFGYIVLIKTIDWFESIEWHDMRSVTFRIYVINQDIDAVYGEVKEYLKERVCKIR